ncbi:MAG TPA: GTP-binding protein [Xanthomonadales bacterium]|nr:GTP-binding protein [Xanthomonadales bacterium]
MPADDGARGGDHLETAADSLRALLDDASVPAAVREALRADYEQVAAMLEKLERGDLHIAVFGRVSVGKSALLNALLGRDEFEVGVLHGTTRHGAIRAWRRTPQSAEAPGSHLPEGITEVRIAPGETSPSIDPAAAAPAAQSTQASTEPAVHLIDTPGINELDGEAREALAHEIASRADLVLFVVDGDMTASEREALALIAREQRPIVLVLNKADRYTEAERALLLDQLRVHARGIVARENVVAVSAAPPPRTVVRVDADGREREAREPQPRDLAALDERIVAIVAAEGRTLAALNAVLFAGRLSDSVAARIAEARAMLAEQLIRSYCLAKGLAVAINPIPVADLLAAAALDVGLVTHLSRVYGLPLTRVEAGRLLATITGSLAALMGAIWGAHLVSSALKGVTAGLSTLLTAAAQGALAWYATLIVGRAAQEYLRHGKSWSELGPKRAVEAILASLDRDSVLREAREEILARLRRAPS